MLKSFHRCVLLSKFDNGIICCVRQYNRKMQEGNYRQGYENQMQFKDNRNNINDFRKWIPVSPEPKKSGLAFSVLSYNILSQRLLEMHSYLYNHHDNQSLNWNRRFYNLVGEILYNKPDILCCQVWL